MDKNFKLIKKSRVLIRPLESKQSFLIETKNVKRNIGEVVYATDEHKEYEGKLVLFMNGIIEARTQYEHTINGETLQEIDVKDIVGTIRKLED